jgi:hypothetical protein
MHHQNISLHPAHSQNQFGSISVVAYQTMREVELNKEHDPDLHSAKITKT